MLLCLYPVLLIAVSNVTTFIVRVEPECVRQSGNWIDCLPLNDKLIERITNRTNNEYTKRTQQLIDKTPPSKGNGGRTDTYVWSQSLSELTVTIPVPSDTTKKDIVCTMNDNTVKLRVSGVSILDGRFEHEIRGDESFWQLDRAEKVLTLHIDKRDDMNWWSCVLVGDVGIDISKIEPGNSRLDDLDGETRGMVEKMMYDQRQKAAGLPTSDEQQKMKMFENFKQQHPEMDFSQAKFQ